MLGRLDHDRLSVARKKHQCDMRLTDNSPRHPLVVRILVESQCQDCPPANLGKRFVHRRLEAFRHEVGECEMHFQLYDFEGGHTVLAVH